MKPLKIIELTSKSANKSPICAPKDSDEYFFASWAGLFAKRIKKFIPELDVESWRVKSDLDDVREKTIYGIQAIMWPYRHHVVKDILTYEMIKRLKTISKNYFIILHYHSLFNIKFVLFAKLFLKDIKIILSHHGGNPPINRALKNFMFKYLLKKNNIALITYLTPKLRNYIKGIKNHPEIEFLPVGADFNLHCGGDKYNAREKLGLDKNKIYAIYVGSYYKLKSVDLILKIHDVLKSKCNFAVIFVGGVNNKENDLYDEVIKSGNPNFGIIPSNEMPLYYQASDFYIHPAFNPEFGGLDVSWMESLANNRPVISSQINYLDFDYSELGMYYANKDEILDKTEYMIDNFNKFQNCREIAKNHLDGNSSIMMKLFNIYENIYNK